MIVARVVQSVMKRFLTFLKNEYRHWKAYFKYRPLFNVNKTAHAQNALVSYITEPFVNAPSVAHTNLQEALALAKILDELKFNVDVMQYDDNSLIDYSKYSFIIGFGEPLINSYYAPETPKNCIRVFYGTGMHINDQNHATLKRVKEVFEKTGKWFPSAGRIVDKAWTIQTTLVDAIITFGEDKLIEGYRKFYSGPILKIPVTSYETFSGDDFIDTKDFSQAKNHFYFQGGTQGSIHRSLDLLLEYFDKHPAKHLHIATSFKMEKGFEEAYHEQLYNRPNIHTYGFISHKSETARNILNTCAFLIFPSCSEGTSTSVINLMRGGLIPLVTEQTGLPKKDFIISIDEISAKGIENTIAQTETLTATELKKMSKESYTFTRATYTLEEHTKKMKEAIKTVLQHE